jgi:hypothetical protein
VIGTPGAPRGRRDSPRHADGATVVGWWIDAAAGLLGGRSAWLCGSATHRSVTSPPPRRPIASSVLPTRSTTPQRDVTRGDSTSSGSSASSRSESRKLVTRRTHPLRRRDRPHARSGRRQRRCASSERSPGPARRQRSAEDILISARLPGREAVLVVDCKRYGEEVDFKDTGLSLAGMLAPTSACS